MSASRRSKVAIVALWFGLLAGCADPNLPDDMLNEDVTSVTQLAAFIKSQGKRCDTFPGEHADEAETQARLRTHGQHHAMCSDAHGNPTDVAGRVLDMVTEKPALHR